MRVKSLVIKLTEKVEHLEVHIMATLQEILDGIAATNNSLDGIQTDIAALQDAANGGASLATIKTAIDALAAKAAGIDAENPTP